MELIPVQSDAIAAVGYHKGTLVIQYRNGKSYHHHNVPEPLFSDLLAAESKGQFVNKYIKPKYPVKK